jgi:hypothetical protein
MNPRKIRASFLQQVVTFFLRTRYIRKPYTATASVACALGKEKLFSKTRLGRGRGRAKSSLSEYVVPEALRSESQKGKRWVFFLLRIYNTTLTQKVNGKSIFHSPNSVMNVKKVVKLSPCRCVNQSLIVRSKVSSVLII